MRFTLDTHCLSVLCQPGQEADGIRGLAAAHEAGRAQFAMVALADHRYLDTSIQGFQHFQSRLQSLGLGQIELLRPMTYFDIAFPEWSQRPTEELEDIEREIHSILYPSIHYAWKDFRKANQIDDAKPPKDSPWRHAKCDVQMILAHIENEGEVFVTKADIFHRDLKKRQLIALGAKAIEYPMSAVTMV